MTDNTQNEMDLLARLANQPGNVGAFIEKYERILKSKPNRETLKRMKSVIQGTVGDYMNLYIANMKPSNDQPKQRRKVPKMVSNENPWAHHLGLGGRRV